MSLSDVQFQTLRAVCDTLIPESGDWLPAAVAEAMATTGNPSDLAQFRLALGLLEAPAAGLLLEGSWRRFSQQDRQRREAILRAWASHPLPQMRTAFQAFKRLSGFLYNTAPDNPLLAQLGYAGRRQPEPAAPALRVEPLGSEARLTADAVVIGSGAGGGVAAALLASRGLQVIVLEQGGHFPEAELGMPERDGMQQLYLDRGMTATRDLSIAVMAGSAVGGGTLVNWTACIAPPDWLRDEWERQHGLTGLTGAGFQEGVDAVLNRLGVHSGESASSPSSQAGRLLAGCRALGYQAGELPRNVTGCGDDCGGCTFGCRAGAKQSTARTFLLDAVEQGARIIPRAAVRRVLVEGGRAVGVEALVAGRTVTIRAPRVILAAGAIGTPAVLLRSGLGGGQVGRNLHLHPVTAVVGFYEEPVHPWSGRLLPAYSSQFARLDGNYGFLLEVAPSHPGMGALGTPWYSGQQYMEDLGRLSHAGIFIALVRDRGSGRVTVDRAGRHQINYALSAYDRQHLLRGQQEAIRVHGAAGASRIATLHASRNVLEGASPERVEAFARQSLTLSSGPNQLMLLCAHQMGTARMGRSATAAVADPAGAVFGVKGLWVTDASAFPSASGVNPMVTIMSLAHWVARQIA